MFPHAAEAGQDILVLGQFHLCPGLGSLCTAGEDVEDQVTAVNGFYLQGFFNIVDLRAAEFVIMYGCRGAGVFV